MSRTRRHRQRRPRLVPELAPGEALPRGEQYMLPGGEWTRDRQFALTLRRLKTQGITPWLSPLVFPVQRGLVPMSMLIIDGQQVPVYMNPELGEDYDPTFDTPGGVIPSL
jgi:hypothetical protein